MEAPASERDSDCAPPAASAPLSAPAATGAASPGGPRAAAATQLSSPPGAGQRMLTPLMMDQVCIMLFTVGQVLMTASTWRTSSDATTRASLLAITAFLAWSLYFVLRSPKKYWRNRLWALPLARVALVILPVQRQAGAGSSLTLKRMPQAGLLGAVLDIVRMLLGTRQLQQAMAGVGAMLPPGLTLLTQSAVAVLTYNSQDFAKTQLLAHMVTRARMARIAAVFEFLSLPLLAVSPVPLGLVLAPSRTEPPPVDAAYGDALSRSFVSFHHLLFIVVLPTVASVLWWNGRQEASGASASSSGAPSGLRKLEAASSGLDRAVVRALKGHPALGGPWGVAWFVLSFSWLACKHGL